MIAIIPLFLISIGIYGFFLLLIVFGSNGMLGLNKTLSSCPVLFLLYSKDIEAKSNFLFFSMLICVSIISICSFIGSSNHFIISPDILYFLSLMMLIFYHTFKLSKHLLLR